MTNVLKFPAATAVSTMSLSAAVADKLKNANEAATSADLSLDITVFSNKWLRGQ
jgi:hypothetical protein